MQTEKKCINCINFKTLTITRKNIGKFPIAQNNRVRKKLKKLLEVPIFFCKLDMLPQAVYTTLYLLERIINKKCKFFDIIPKFLYNPINIKENWKE